MLPLPMSRLRAYLGMSLDGRIAGVDDDLDWLTFDRARRVDTPVPSGSTPWLSYEDFTADIGVMLMGRRTYDVVATFDEWFYGSIPVLVATSRDLDPVVDTVRAVRGTLDELVAAARAAAGSGDVYVDGGRLVSSLLDAGMLDEVVTTVLPTVRGSGIGLFDTVTGPHDLDLVGVAVNDGGAVQLTWVPQTQA